MAIIKFNLEQFTPIPKGERKLMIKEAKCIPSGAPNKMEITFSDLLTGKTLKSTYDFNREGAMRALGFLCRVALNLPDMEEFDTKKDTEKLVGKILLCEVIHNEGNQPKEDGTYPVFANISKIIELVEQDIDIPGPAVSSPRNSIAGGDLD